MPLYCGDSEFVERIKPGEDLVRRVYKADGTLTYGLFDVNYFSKGDKLEIEGYPSEYAWGKERPIPLDCEELQDSVDASVDGAFASDKVHWLGWHDDYTLESDLAEKIEKTDRSDLNFFADWRRRRYYYKGVVAYNAGSGEEPTDPPSDNQSSSQSSQGTATGAETIPSGARTTIPAAGSNYYWPAFATYGQCTYYCYCRSGEYSGHFAPNDVKPNTTGVQKYGNAIEWTSALGNLANPVAGSILVCTCSGNSAGHVMFVESVGANSITCSDSNIPYRGLITITKPAGSSWAGVSFNLGGSQNWNPASWTCQIVRILKWYPRRSQGSLNN